MRGAVIVKGHRSAESRSSTSPGDNATTPVDARPDLITVLAHMRAKPGKEQDLHNALEALIEPTSQEEGYVNYDLH